MAAVSCSVVPVAPVVCVTSGTVATARFEVAGPGCDGSGVVSGAVFAGGAGFSRGCFWDVFFALWSRISCWFRRWRAFSVAAGGAAGAVALGFGVGVEGGVLVAVLGGGKDDVLGAGISLSISGRGGDAGRFVHRRVPKGGKRRTHNSRVSQRVA